MGSESPEVNAQSITMIRDICFLGMLAALLNLCESEAQFGFGGGAALQNCAGSNCNQNNGFGGRTFGSTPGSGGRGVAVQNCVGSNCNSNNFFARKRREVLEEVIARVEEEPSTERRRLLEEILTEVEEFELSGERRPPSLDSIGQSSGLENTSYLLQQIVEKLDELQSKFGAASSSAFPTFPAGTKFYTSDGRGGLSAIGAPIISVPLEKSYFNNDPVKRTEESGELIISLTEQVKSHFDINPVKKTEEISEQINSLTEQEKREITKLLLKKLIV